MRFRNPLAMAAGLTLALGAGAVLLLAWYAVTSGWLSSLGAAPPRTIEVSMTDGLRFDPNTFSVRSGETIRFAITNPTAIDHDVVLGDEALQEMHAGMMAGGTMQDDAHAVSVPAGQTRELTFTFGAPGKVLIGCHVVGHYEAGMRADVTVNP